jgi:hypothetical protein
MRVVFIARRCHNTRIYIELANLIDLGNMKIIAFVGPSGHHLQGLYPRVEFAPPAASGDLDETKIGEFNIVIFADGVFFTRCAPTHYEILRVLERRQTIIGVSSMGALRAAELSGYGIIGFGNVYRNILQGNITDDSELAAAIHPIGFRPLTISLINVRSLLSEIAGDFGDEEMFQSALVIARDIYFMNRTREKLLQAWQYFGEHFISEVKRAFERGQYDIKHSDFRCLLDLISREEPDLTAIENNTIQPKPILLCPPTSIQM